jgi:transmembrane sensor
MQSTAESAPRDPTTLHAAQGAAHWLATLSDENCSEAQRQQFFEWLRGSTHNVDEFLRLSTLTRHAGKRELWPDQSIEALIAAARASANVTELASDKTENTRSRARTIVPWAIAASLACVGAIGALVLSNTRVVDMFTGVYSTHVGEQRSIALEDGSVVELNSQSRLRTRFSAGLRAVELLEGEAIFRVSKDPQRPFRVRTGATDIVAIGTAFNVNATEARTIVTVLEGRVRVNNRAETPADAAPKTGDSVDFVELAVGEQVIVARERPIVRVALNDTQKVTSWTERRLIFEETTIAAAASEFARYSAREIRIEDPQVGARKITGVFDATDPASLMEFLSSDETLEVRPNGDGWLVRGRNQQL